MICPKCHKQHGVYDSDVDTQNDLYLCWSCMYRDDIEREMLKEMDDECAEDCQVD